MLQQLRIAAYMVGMMVGVYDRSKLEMLGAKIIEDGARIPRIYRGCMGRVAQRPDVIVGKRPEWNDFARFHRVIREL